MGIRKKYSIPVKILFQDRGYSAIEVMVSLALMAGVAMSSAYLIVSSKKVEVTSDIINMINQEQTSALQKVRSPNRLREALVAADSKLDLLNPESNFSQCFGGRGTGCRTQFDTSGVFRNIPMLSSIIPTAGGQSIITSGSYSIVCSQEENCEQVKIKLDSVVTGGTIAASQNMSRYTMVQIPARSLTDRQQISFTCASASSGDPEQAQQIMTGMDLKNLIATCTPLPNDYTTECNLGPMTQYRINDAALCQSLENINCTSTGVQRVGVLANQSRCWPATTTTTTLVAPVCPTGKYLSGGVCVDCTNKPPNATVVEYDYSSGLTTNTCPIQIVNGCAAGYRPNLGPASGYATSCVPFGGKCYSYTNKDGIPGGKTYSSISDVCADYTGDQAQDLNVGGVYVFTPCVGKTFSPTKTLDVYCVP